jgi:glycosyltransferase involved in cell wall biosynthesis
MRKFVRIAMIGTRGVPARYGGFETAVEEVGRRLVARGHEVVVYSRGEKTPEAYLGMERVVLPALRRQSAETLSHSALSVAHLLAHRCDVAIVFNAANAVFVPAVRAAGIPVAVHVDGLEWKRAKWGPAGRRWYLWGERLAVRWAHELIADSTGIEEYYRERYGCPTRLLTYGAPILTEVNFGRLAELGLERGGYHLVVARLEPENNVEMITRGYLASSARKPLIIVGSVPYPSDHERMVTHLAASDDRIRMLGGIWDQDLLNVLYAGSATYLHGHSVGGTNPSLLRAMGAGAAAVAYDVVFNRDVLGTTGEYFSDVDSVRQAVETAELDEHSTRARGAAARERAAVRYRWDEVALGYERLCVDLMRRRGRVVGETPVTAKEPQVIDITDAVLNARPATSREGTMPEEIKIDRTGR